MMPTRRRFSISRSTTPWGAKLLPDPVLPRNATWLSSAASGMTWRLALFRPHLARGLGQPTGIQPPFGLLLDPIARRITDTVPNRKRDHRLDGMRIAKAGAVQAQLVDPDAECRRKDLGRHRQPFAARRQSGDLVTQR